MIRNPEYFEVKGNGKLVSDNFIMDISFEVFLINKKIAIYCYQNKYDAHSLINRFHVLDAFENYFSLTGITEKNEKIQAIKLTLTELNDKFIEFIPNSQIIIGSYFEPFADKIIYPLPNLFEFNFNLEYDGFNIELIPESDTIDEKTKRNKKRQKETK